MSTDHEEKMVNLTRQMRHNQSDLQSFLSDLDSWETDIKKKEEKLLSGKTEKTDSLPPVRNTINKKKLKKKRKEKGVDPNREKKINGFDFRSWDKFDVDAALDDIDTQEKKETSSSEYETDEEWEMERKLHLAGIEKEKGNKAFKNEEYDLAVEAYSKGMEYDGTNAVLPANRAMALLKQQKYAAAELDCTSSISLDPLYVKAYLRRATARVGLNKHDEAIEDYNRVLDLEPTNKMAKTELERLQKVKNQGEKAAIPSTLTDDERGRVKAIYKSPNEMSKVPLKRIEIEEIGIETAKRNQHPLTEQSEMTRKITERESKNFDHLLSPSEVHEQNNNKSKIESSVEDSSKKDIIKDMKADVSVNERKDDVQPLPGTEKLKVMENVSIPVKEDLRVNGIHQVESKPNGTGHVSSKKSSHNKGEESVPDIPHTSFQFQTDFKRLKTKTEVFFKYFTAIDPAQYHKLFGQCMDADILKTIIKSLLEHSQGSRVNVYEMLCGLTHVKRFSMTAMFLSRKEKQDARELMERISSSNQCSSAELSSLKQKYDL